MNLYNIRLHIRVLRRLSMAVNDQADPKYEDSALFFFDKNEEIFGRKASQTAMQESGKSFDAFQSAIPDLNDLRSAAETFHVMLLRGYHCKVSAREVGNFARAVVLMTKIPSALIPRFPLFVDLLAVYTSLQGCSWTVPHVPRRQATNIRSSVRSPWRRSARISCCR